MSKLLACVAMAVGVFASSAAFAADKTITLAVKNMYCAACPHTVKASLQAVSHLPGPRRRQGIRPRREVDRHA